jgi:hypothetical protein
MEKKVNIGAGRCWYKSGWDTLESEKDIFFREGQFVGKAWNTKLKSNNYDILFAGNLLEHVTHFRIENTIAEFNRIMKVGGIIRISVPDLSKAVQAYIDNDDSFFDNEKSNQANHLGIGGKFLNNIISPGHDVIVFSGDFNELLGSYAHTYAYDFEMIKIYLEKWGFGKIVKSEFKKSSILEMQEEQHILRKGKKYDFSDDNEISSELVKDPENCYISGFDSYPNKTLFIEAEKIKDCPYSFDLEFEYNKRSRADGFIDSLKQRLFYIVSVTVDFFFIKLKLFALARKILGKS